MRWVQLILLQLGDVEDVMDIPKLRWQCKTICNLAYSAKNLKRFDIPWG